MPNLTPRKPSAAMLVAVTALVSSLAGPAVADEVAQIAQSITSSKQIANGSVTGADVKNNSLTTTDLLDGSVTSADIGTGQVNTSELAPDSVRGDKIPANTIDGSDIQDGSIKGRDIEIGNLGKVSSAGRADSADSADSARTLVKIDARLQPGQSKTVATVGAIALTARCRDDAGTRYVELLASTTAANAYMDGEDTLDGGTTAADFLQPSTPAEDRQLFEDSTSTGDTTPELDNDIDQAWIVGPGGEYIGVDGETLAIGHNALGGKCTLIGNAVAIG